MRIAVDWLLLSDIGEVIKAIVDDEAGFPDYAMPRKRLGEKTSRGANAPKKRLAKALGSLMGELARPIFR